MASNLNRTHVAAFTPNYLFRGLVVTGAKRLSDVLNDRITAYLELRQARVYNLNRPDKQVFSAEELYLKKERVEIVTILREEILQPTRRIYSYVQKEKRPAMLFLRTFELRGYIHLHGKHEVQGPLTREGELYIPVTEATLVSTLNPRVRVTASTVMLRERALDGFYIAEEGFLKLDEE